MSHICVVCIHHLACLTCILHIHRLDPSYVPHIYILPHIGCIFYEGFEEQNRLAPSRIVLSHTPPRQYVGGKYSLMWSFSLLTLVHCLALLHSLLMGKFVQHGYGLYLLLYPVLHKIMADLGLMVPLIMLQHPDSVNKPSGDCCNICNVPVEMAVSIYVFWVIDGSFVCHAAHSAM